MDSLSALSAVRSVEENKLSCSRYNLYVQYDPGQGLVWLVLSSPPPHNQYKFTSCLFQGGRGQNSPGHPEVHREAGGEEQHHPEDQGGVCPRKELPLPNVVPEDVRDGDVLVL